MDTLNMSVGIDRISFYTPRYYIDTLKYSETLGIKKEVLLRTIGQYKNALISENEDIISMGINAAKNIIHEGESFDFCIFATESSFDSSKASSLYVSDYLRLNSDCSCFEIKQACYSSTAALIFAINYIKNKKNAKILIIASDVAKYEPNTNGEFTNGAGAVAFIVSSNPKIIEINDDFQSIHKDSYDFFKPQGLEYPIVLGTESMNLYLHFFKELYSKLSSKKFDFLVNHMPFPLMFDKVCHLTQNSNDFLYHKNEIKFYSEQIGNSYSASLYLSFCSLIDNLNKDISAMEVLFFAYGSGAVGTMFSGRIVDGYQKFLQTESHKNLIEKRDECFDFKVININNSSDFFVLDKIENYRRFYKKNG